MKIWLIQNIISPYRIKLFQTISETRDVEFKLILLSDGLKYLPQWNFKAEDMPFKAESVGGFVFYPGYESQICINPSLLVKMIKEKPDVVICAGFSFASLTTLIYKLIFKGRYIIWMEGTHITEANRSKPRIALRKLMARYASGFVDAGTLSKKYLQALLPKQQSKPFFRSYNCIDNKKFEDDAVIDSEELKKFRKRYCDRNILFIGQLIKRKGIIQILETYKKIVENHDISLGLILVGEGPMRDYIETFKEKYQLHNIFIEGFLDNDLLGQYYGFCDLFILLSLNDPNPLVVFEALATGIPIICSNHAGNSVDFIVDGENGYTVDPNDKESIFRHVREVLSWDSHKRRKAAEMSRQLVSRANYTDSAKAFVDACRFVMEN